MNTDDLIRTLATDRETAKGRWPVSLRLMASALLSLAAVVALTAVMMGVRPDLADAALTPGGAAKFIIALAFAVAACAALARAAEPGRIVRLDVIGMALGLALAAGALSAIVAPGAALAGSPLDCMVSILGLAIVPFMTLVVALRHGAPTSPAATGALAGIAASGIAAFGYGLSCPMDLGPYVALWYPLAIAAAGALGMMMGRRALAW